MAVGSSDQLIGFLSKRGYPFSVLHHGGRPVTRPCSLSNPCEDGFSFYAKKRWTDFEIDLTKIGFLFIPPDIDTVQLEELNAQAVAHDSTIVQTEKPRLVFLDAVGAFFQPYAQSGIDPSASVDVSCQIASTATVKAGARLGADVRVGEHTVVSENCVIGSGTTIGDHCFFAPGVLIGQSGFGYERAESGEMVHFPHIGNVEIGNHVEVGANTCIDRGTLDNTIICDGVKIDNLCHISHNVYLGKDCVIVANTMVGGSTRIGARSWISPSCSILNGLTIGADVMVGMGAVVVKPVADGMTVLGSPAISMRDFLANKKRLTRLYALSDNLDDE